MISAITSLIRPVYGGGDIIVGGGWLAAWWWGMIGAKSRRGCRGVSEKAKRGLFWIVGLLLGWIVGLTGLDSIFATEGLVEENCVF
jgi:hypothetical protein